MGQPPFTNSGSDCYSPQLSIRLEFALVNKSLDPREWMRFEP